RRWVLLHRRLLLHRRILSLRRSWGLLLRRGGGGRGLRLGRSLLRGRRGLRPSSSARPCDHDLDATVLRAALWGVVAGNRVGFALPFGLHHRDVQPVLREEGLHRIGALLREI